VRAGRGAALSDRLRGTATAGKPLAAAIGALVRELTAESGIPVTFFEDGEHSLDAARKGAVPHRAAGAGKCAPACAREGHRRLAHRHEAVRHLEGLDDGIGFDKRNVAPGHHGITGMRERAQAMGGTLQITTHPRRGTRLTVRVPAR